MLKKYTLNKQIQLSFLAVLICTFISTLLAMVTFFLLSMLIAYPANYYDRQIPEILSYVEEHANDLLIGLGKEDLEARVNLNEIQYKIINFTTDESYGNYSRETPDKGLLIKKLNRQESDTHNNYTAYFPLINSGGILQGCFLITYPIRMTPISNQRLLLGLITLIIFCLPFIFLILYMWLFGKRLTSNIMKPLVKLQWASNKIRNNDLDFKLEYEYPNELGEVITSFEQMRKQLKETLYRQWQLEQQQKEMIGALAHDLRTPLTIIKGHLELLQEGAYRNEARCLKYLTAMEGATQRATLLVEDLNLLSDLDRINLSVQVEPVEIASFIKRIMCEYQVVAQQKNLELVLRIKEEMIDDKIMVDPLRLSQMIDNIMMNAFRYAKHLIVVRLTHTESNEVQITIANDGPNFSKEELEKACDRFYRKEVSRSNKEAHSGLGLYSCKCLTEQQGGRISLFNHNELGACVSIIFPLSDAK